MSRRTWPAGLVPGLLSPAGFMVSAEATESPNGRIRRAGVGDVGGTFTSRPHLAELQIMAPSGGRA